MSTTNYRSIIRNKAIEYFQTCMTTEREDTGLTPYTETEQKAILANLVESIGMIEDFDNDDDLESLSNPENDWIREYFAQYYYIADSDTE